jgi:hypothetical protein
LCQARQQRRRSRSTQRQQRQQQQPQKKEKKYKNPMEKTFKILHRKNKLLTQGEKEKIKVFVYNLTGRCF